MCGIVAVLGKPSEDIYTAFKRMLHVGMTRGRDSTGVAGFYVDNSRKIKEHIVKEVMFPCELVETPEYVENIKSNSDKFHCLIGHNRSATKGSIIRDNAHPFMFNNTILVHNGTLFTNISYKGAETFKTDSESIAASVEDRGIKETWKDLDGAAALCWFNKSSNSLTILRNDKRPLFFMRRKDKSAVFIASESWMIRDVCGRLNIKLESTAWSPKENVAFSFSLNKKGKIIESSKEYTPYIFSAISPNNVYSWENDIKNKNKKIVEGEDKETLPFGKRSVEEKKGMEAGSISCNKKIFEEKYKNCYFCHDKLEYEGFDGLIVDAYIAVCGGCCITADLNDINLLDNLL